MSLLRDKIIWCVCSLIIESYMMDLCAIMKKQGVYSKSLVRDKIIWCVSSLNYRG